MGEPLESNLSATDNLPVVYLRPGEFHFATTPTVVVPVLDSCLAVTFFSRRLAAGGVCHLLLAEGEVLTEELRTFAVCAVRHFLDRFRRLGAPPGEIEVRLCGSAVLPEATGANVAEAIRLLEAEGLLPVPVETGGARGRKLYFHTHSGEIALSPPDTAGRLRR
jgi:chemotaxis protein CheD